MAGSTAKWIVLVTILLAILTAGIASFYTFNSFDLEEDGHFDRDETRLTIVNTSGARLSLIRSGATLDSATLLGRVDKDEMWLAKGDYFLRADYDPATAYYPINIPGYRGGPEADGSLAVTVRPLPATEPPLPLSSAGGFVYVPPGYFLLGDRLNPNEPHFVWTQGYFIGAFEVTNSEFNQFQASPDGYRDNSNWTDDGLNWKKANVSRASAFLSAGDPEFVRFGQADLPVTQVTWYEAIAYCRWLTRRLGLGNWIYSLPSEAEWEKAARGPDGFDYPLSRNIGDAEAGLYNWKKNPLAERTVFGVAESRRLYRPNRYGIYHMGGNVVEWTQTLYRPYNRQVPYSEDDRNRDDRKGPRVARGGSWYSASTALLYIPYRDAFQPEISHHDLGFRIVVKQIQ